jgi:hypothetical protein
MIGRRDVVGRIAIRALWIAELQEHDDGFK